MPVGAGFAERVRSFDEWARWLLTLENLAGLSLVGLGVVWACLGILGAVRGRGFGDAREITGKVVSIRKANIILPKLDVAVSWSEGGADRQTVVRVPRRNKAVAQRNRQELVMRAADLQAGDSVKFLFRNKDQFAILPSQRPSLGGLVGDFIVGLIFCFFGTLFLSRGDVHPNKVLHFWPEGLMQRVVERITGAPFPPKQPKVVEELPVPPKRPQTS